MKPRFGLGPLVAIGLASGGCGESTSPSGISQSMADDSGSGGSGGANASSSGSGRSGSPGSGSSPGVGLGSGSGSSSGIGSDSGSGSSSGVGSGSGSGASSGVGSDSGSGSSSGVGSTGSACATPPTRSGMRGKTMRSLMAGGLSRTYVTYLPPSLNPNNPAPFVYVFHGFTMSGAQMYDITQYATLADSEGVAVVFPDGQSGSPWNVSDNAAAVCGAGNAVNNANAADFAFMDAMMADVQKDQCVDVRHVFATGFSMGGYFAHHIGCDRMDIHGVAPHSGGTIADLSGCKTGHVPIIIFHGAADGLIADGCDDPNGAAQAGFPPSATLWAKKNGCGNTYATAQVVGSGGGMGQCYLYDGCPTGGQVELCTFSGMSHGWAGGSNTGQGGSFAFPTYASATQLQWAFWKKYAW